MKKAVIVILVLFFIQGIIHNLGHPVTPAFVRGLNIPDYMFGFFYSSMSFGLMIGSPIWGILADRGRKRLIMAIGLLLYSLGQFGFGYVNNMYLMVGFRFLSGFGVSASMTLFTSHMIEVSSPSNRAKHLAWLAAGLTLGAAIGYAIGGFISNNPIMVDFLGTADLRIVFAIQGTINLLHTLNVFLFVKEEHVIERTNKKPSFIESFRNIGKINKNLLLFLIALSFVSIAITNLTKYLDVYFDELGYTSQDIGNFVFVTGIVSLFTSIFIVPLIAKLNRNLIVILLTQIISILVVLYVFRANNFLLAIYTVYMLFIMSRSIFQPLEQSFIANRAKDGFFSSTMGIRQSFYSIGMIIGPLVGGFLYEISPLVLFNFSALMIFLGLIIFFFVYIRIRKEQLENH